MNDELHLDGDAGPQEAPPTDADAARATSSGAARRPVGGAVKRGRGRPKGSKTKSRSTPKRDDAVREVRALLGGDPEAQALAEELTRELASPDELADVLAALFALPGALVDESFSLTDEQGKPTPRCRLAARRMFPLVKRYGSASIARWLPEIMFAFGVVGLLQPCVVPTLAIVTGQRAPLMFRGDESAAAPTPIPLQAVQ